MPSSSRISEYSTDLCAAAAGGGGRIALSYVLFSLSRMCSFQTLKLFLGEMSSKFETLFFPERETTFISFVRRKSIPREEKQRSLTRGEWCVLLFLLGRRSAWYQREHGRERDIPELDNDFSRVSCVDGYSTTATKSASPRSSTAPTTVSRTWQTALDLPQAWNETYVVTTR